MMQIPLQILPNQQLQTIIDGYRFDIRLMSCFDVMCVDIYRDGASVVRGMRVVAQEMLIPYEYMEGGAGNFLFFTQNDDIPNYLQFNSTQFLYHLTDAEARAYGDG